MQMDRFVLGLAVAGWLSLACGHADLGESCDNVGSTDDCGDDAICTNEDGGGVCRALCDATPSCPALHTCNGVSGTNLKSCQPDKK